MNSVKADWSCAKEHTIHGSMACVENATDYMTWLIKYSKTSTFQNVGFISFFFSAYNQQPWSNFIYVQSF